MRDIFKTALQKETWSCGPAAIVNAVTVLGLIIEEEVVQKFADAEKGMNERRMIEALESLGLEPIEYTSLHADLAWRALQKNLPAILCVDKDQHWIAVTGVNVDGTVEVRDPNLGTRAYDQEKLVDRWMYKGRFYMINFRSVK